MDEHEDADAAGPRARGARLGPRLPEPDGGRRRCVRDGAVVGEGWHEGPGTAHAEVMALAAGR